MAVLTINFLSETLGHQTSVTVCLPSFSMQDILQHDGKGNKWVPGMKFQTLYLLHGGSSDENGWLWNTNVARYADDNNIAVVMPNGYLNRYTDWSGWSQFFKYVADELPHVMQTMLPLSDKREDNFIAGFSMGSSGALKTALLRPEKFCAVVPMSGCLIANTKRGDVIGGMPRPITADDAELFTFDKLQARVDEMMEKGIEIPKIIMTWGGDDTTVFHIDPMVADYFKEKGLNPRIEVIPGYYHAWDFWDVALERAMREWLPARHAPIYPEA